MAKKTAYELMEGRQFRRMKEEDRFMDKLDKQWKMAEQMIGELMRNGKIIYYIFPQGGRYREGTQVQLFEFLVRNRYI